MVDYKWISPVILMVLISGAWITLTPTDNFDVCRFDGEYGTWTNTTETVYVNKDLSAVGKYYCDAEDKELWCGRTTKTRCYYILEEKVPIKAQIPQKPNKYINWSKYDNLNKYELDDRITHRGIYLKHDYQLEQLKEFYPSKIDRMESEYLKVKYQPLPTPEQLVEINSEIDRLTLENEELEAIMITTDNETLKQELSESFNGNNEVIDSLYENLELNETKQYLVDKISRLKDKYALVILDLDVRATGLLERDPIGTTYYIDHVNGDDANNGTETYSAWQNISKYTSVTTRTAGDIGYVRAGQTHIYAADINFDEDGTGYKYIELRGATSTDDPWGDGSDVKPIISFGNLSYQFTFMYDNYWKLSNLEICESIDSYGLLHIANSDFFIIQNCDIHYGGSSSVEGIYIEYSEIVLIDSCNIYNVGDDLIFSLTSDIDIIDTIFNGGGSNNVNSAVALTRGSYVNIINSSIGKNSNPIYSELVFISDSYCNIINTYLSKDLANTLYIIKLNIEDYNKTKGEHLMRGLAGVIYNESTIVRSGGADSSAKMSPVINCGIIKPLTLSDNPIQGDFRIWTPASATTITIYIRGYSWLSYPTNSELFIETSYLNNANNADRTTTKSTQVLTDNTNWVAFTNTFTPAREGFAYVTVNLGKYVSGDGVYVDIKPVVS